MKKKMLVFGTFLITALFFIGCATETERDINKMAGYMCELADLNERAMDGEDVEEELYKLIDEIEALEKEMEKKYEDEEEDEEREKELEEKLKQALIDEGCWEFFEDIY